jgi:mannose/cellobiose epimerase-like protein (N-acyl-D-glucosamine 2-epimerase family)
VSPPSAPASAIFQPSRWVEHLEDDLLPYWEMEPARGDPVGNFPTYRTMTGQVATPAQRRPRMLSRQTYAYATGYLLTGDPELLRLAKAGADWLMEHAPDPTFGGYHAVLNEDGTPSGSGAKTAQDAAYVMLGLGAYYFVTRDPAVEAEILEGRDLLFDPAVYWDEDDQRIVDALSADLTEEIDWAGEGQPGDGGWEIVAQLDPINAFMLLTQPVLSDRTRRDQFLADMRTLSQTMIDHFFEDGLFWGAHNVRRYGTRHVDFGHALKAYWMILQVDKRLDGSPFFDVIASNAPALLERAYDDNNGRWGKRPTSATNNEYGSDWWIYAESDQIAATLTMGGAAFGDELENTAANWITDFVDDRPAGEVIPGIDEYGSPASDWPDSNTMKCWRWKNGYHSVEHALVMYLFSSWRTDRPAELYFAVPDDDASDFVARPYFFDGAEAGREPLDAIDVDGTSLRRVRVQFDDLY